MVDPNLQTLPRGDSSEVQKWVKEMFVAGEGKVFWERDFSAIEAVLVGYFAGSEAYVKFAKLGVHAYLASHILKRPADLSWSESDLRAYFKQLKSEDPLVYSMAKRVVHSSNYMATARKMHYEYPETFRTVEDAMSLQGLYFELFPEIRRWHKDTCTRVDAAKKSVKDPDAPVDPWSIGVCYVQNPFGYVHRFYNVLDWEKIEGEWISTYGEDAKRLISFLPQSTAAAIIKRAGKKLWNEYPWVGQTMRLWIHDAILGEAPEAMLDSCLDISAQVMQAPIPQLPLDPSWGLGEYLSIGTEAKVGPSWASMH